MKTNLNLAMPPRWRERYGLQWAIPTAIVALLVLGWMVRATAREWGRYRRVEAQVKALTRRANALALKNTSLRRGLNRPQDKLMYRDTRLINRLIANRKYAIENLMRSASEPLTANVRLRGVAVATWPPSATGVPVQLEVQAKTERDLETFVSNLEQSSAFNNVAVKRVRISGGDSGDESDAGPEEDGYIAAICVAVYVPQPEGVVR